MTGQELVGLAKRVEAEAEALVEAALDAPEGALVPGLFEFADRLRRAHKTAVRALAVSNIRRGKPKIHARVEQVNEACALIEERKKRP